jgi:hypothetical protein
MRNSEPRLDRLVESTVVHRPGGQRFWYRIDDRFAANAVWSCSTSRQGSIPGGAHALAQPTAIANHRRNTGVEPLHDHVGSVWRCSGRGVGLHTELINERLIVAEPEQPPLGAMDAEHTSCDAQLNASEMSALEAYLITEVVWQ